MKQNNILARGNFRDPVRELLKIIRVTLDFVQKKKYKNC